MFQPITNLLINFTWRYLVGFLGFWFAAKITWVTSGGTQMDKPLIQFCYLGDEYFTIPLVGTNLILPDINMNALFKTSSLWINGLPALLWRFAIYFMAPSVWKFLRDAIWLLVNYHSSLEESSGFLLPKLDCFKVPFHNCVSVPKRIRNGILDFTRDDSRFLQVVTNWKAIATIGRGLVWVDSGHIHQLRLQILGLPF
jgi:hypothetical protein